MDKQIFDEISEKNIYQTRIQLTKTFLNRYQELDKQYLGVGNL